MLLGIRANCTAQSDWSAKEYIVSYTKSKITIDGRLDESSWNAANWTDNFVDIEGDKQPLPLQSTRAKILWDDQYLYIAATLSEENIWAYQTKRDQVVFLENDFEVFIDPDNDQLNYYELEINAANNVFDLFLPKAYKKGGIAQTSWDIRDLKSAVSVDGTLNNPSDKDKSWTLEMAIPFASLKNENFTAVTPKEGSVWRINFSRVNWKHEIIEGKYQRMKDPASQKILPEYNWVWSPQGLINMHYPERWGYLKFDSKNW